MSVSDRAWMWMEALDALARAERVRRDMFHPQSTAVSPMWEPPVDVLETEREVIVFAAVPGVDPDKINAVIQDGNLRISGQRVLPEQLREATVHRLELPQGRFERAIALPPGRYEQVRHGMSNGCLVVHLIKH